MENYFEKIGKDIESRVITGAEQGTDNSDKAREFCIKVRELAEEYGLPFFIVTDGASMTKNNGNDAIRHARESHTKWEVKNNIDPAHSWEGEGKNGTESK